MLDIAFLYTLLSSFEVFWFCMWVSIALYAYKKNNNATVDFDIEVYKRSAKVDTLIKTLRGKVSRKQYYNNKDVLYEQIDSCGTWRNANVPVQMNLIKGEKLVVVAHVLNFRAQGEHVLKHWSQSVATKMLNCSQGQYTIQIDVYESANVFEHLARL